MITLLHGDNVEASRTELTTIIHAVKDKEIRTLDGKHLDENQLIQAMESGSLFGSTVLVVIENLFTPLGRKTKRIKEFTTILDSAGQTTDCVCWEQKQLSKEVIDCFSSKITSKLFSIPKIIFTFLDNIRPNNMMGLESSLDELLKISAAELVWSMMITRMRQLIQIQSAVTPAKLQAWQVSRLTNQARAFTMDKLMKSYKSMLEMEYSLKSGTSPFTFADMIKQWIIEL
jgi:DNA polymerase III delta subunit